MRANSLVIILKENIIDVNENLVCSIRVQTTPISTFILPHKKYLFAITHLIETGIFHTLSIVNLGRSQEETF